MVKTLTASKPVPVSATAKAREAARTMVVTASVDAVTATLAAGGKIAALAAAYAAAAKAGLKAKEIDWLGKRAVIMAVGKLAAKPAEKLLEKGATRPADVERALTALRQCRSRAHAIVETGASSVRKAKQAKAPAGKVQQVAPAPVAKAPPATIAAVLAPRATKPVEARAFLLDTLALLERSEKSMAKAMGAAERTALGACLTALRTLKLAKPD